MATTTLADVLNKVQGLKKSGNQYKALCPAHDDKNPSLSITEKNSKVLLHCHAGCSQQAVMAALGTAGNPRPQPRTRTKPPLGKIVKVYDYTDADGNLVHQTVRYEPKDFRQRRPDPATPDEYLWTLKDITPVLYRLPEVIQAVKEGSTILLCEGEKDADTAVTLGYVATTSPLGAGKWQASYSQTLTGAHVIILPHQDIAGKAHEHTIVQALRNIVCTIRIVNLPAKDLTDWMEAGHSKAELAEMLENSVSPDKEVTYSSHNRSVVNSTDGLNTLNTLNAYREIEIKPSAPSWPTLHPAALYGLAGDIVRMIEPHTEADPVGLLMQLLCMFGTAVGHTPTFYVDGTDHYMNIMTVLVGQTSKGRKGTSANYIRRLFTWPMDPHDDGDPAYTPVNIVQGLSSGEGLIWQVRNAITKSESIKEKGRAVGRQDVISDPGVDDKRLLVMESEFSRVLRVMDRDTNTLSATIREAWDSGDLRTITKNSPAKATGAHIGIVGHITTEELQRSLAATEAGNGFGNRFLWVCVKRSKLLPEGGALDIKEIEDIRKKRNIVRDALHRAMDVTTLQRDAAARALWHEAYPLLSVGRPGLLGAMTARAEAQVLRLSCLYALLDGTATITRVHLEAALMLWQYAEESAAYIFGDSLGDPLADDILRMLRHTAEGMSRTDIYNSLGRNRKSGEIGAALERLLRKDLARMNSLTTEGAKRPTEMWFSTNVNLSQSTHLTHLTHLIAAPPVATPPKSGEDETPPASPHVPCEGELRSAGTEKTEASENGEGGTNEAKGTLTCYQCCGIIQNIAGYWTCNGCHIKWVAILDAPDAFGPGLAALRETFGDEACGSPEAV